MQLAPMRYTKIDGTAVAVSVTSAAEAKAALKELRHKKRELKFLRGALARRQQSTPQHGEGRLQRKKARHSLPRRFFGGLWRFIAWLIELATVTKQERRARSPVEMEQRAAPHRRDAAQHRRLHPAARRQDADAAVTARPRRYSWCCTTPVRPPPGRSVIGITCGARTDAGPPISTCRRMPNTVAGTTTTAAAMAQF